MNEKYIDQIRANSPTLNQVTFLNHASTAPLHGRTQQAFHDYLNQWSKYDFAESKEKSQLAREEFAKLIGASKEEILFTSDVTQGTNLAVHMLDYDEKSNIVCYWNDYAGQVHSALFLNKKKKIEYRPVPDREGYIYPDDFAEKIDKNTKIVLLSHVQWITGFKSDIKEITKIAHENGAMILVDVIQSSGVLEIDVKDWDVDFLTSGVAKWLLGPNQAGFFYMKKKLIDEYDPPLPGYQGADYGSIDSPYWNVKQIEYREGIDKFQIANIGPMMYQIAYEGMKIITEYGIKKVEKRVLDLTSYLIERIQELGNYEFLSPIEDKYRAGIVNFKVENNIEIAKKLSEEKVVVSSRYGGIRISPHFYNTKEDLDKFIELFKAIKK
ncbi:MAG: aminotransferase class V-fold PLP-dependent enzyme [Candidatus Heimdallarchaeum endolithica]|uniref:Aminotransferase class V-fold PLP-dependent enzyme n=1 Tax=Candidatus Heimdallarchaeum endolithica TaxID=2876572 RepID=A0A9Y1BSQ2_9ARCH|nr:MAG: aminotransferase class V-fold PLP-dependent enzyme [Candidatus Heimdallarchaeum endolithica]